METAKRFVPVTQYCRSSGLSYATVTHLLNSNQLAYITTESGQRRIDTQPTASERNVVLARLEAQEKLLKALCGHLGVAEARVS